MKILLIGKTGQLGTEIININYSFEIIAPDKKQLNILRPDTVEYWIRSYKPDVVINTAAYHNLDECELHPNTANLVNNIAINNLVELCELYDCIFITYSTDYVFDGTKTAQYIETDVPNPLQVYGISKLAGEKVALDYNKSIVIRTCGVYGGIGSQSKGGNCVLNRIQDSKLGKITVSSNQYASPTYAVDLAKATLKLMELNEYGIFHLVNEGCVSWYEFTKEIIEHICVECTITPSTEQQVGNLKRPLNTSLKNVRAKQLGIILPPWQDALTRYIYSGGSGRYAVESQLPCIKRQGII